jgi:two-component system nitrogen regulation response regulator GlnG
MRERPKLLVVDDGDRYIELAHAFLRDYDYATRCDLEGPCWTCPKRQGCTLTHAHDAGEADETLLKHNDVDVVLLDVAFDVPEARLLPSSEKLSQRRRFQGLQILEHLRRQRGDLPVVLMTSKDDLASDREHALRADEFVSLAGEAAFDARALSLLVERVLARRRESPEAGGYTWGKTAAMAKLRRDVQALARTSLPMLVLGETGTGKSALAERVIHPATRRKGPFIAIDLASIPESLAASELFGTARGAFSGALDRKGRFEEAHGGTLFLDEIGNLPIEAQRMLLLALQDGRITRLGESTPRAVDVKLIAATNEELEEKVQKGLFRADLYARLNPAARLRMPPLRERMVDVPQLLLDLLKRRFAAGPDRALLAAYMEAAEIRGVPRAEVHGGRAPKETSGVAFVLTRGSLADIERHAFPGNVRELELFVTNVVVFALTDALEALEQGRGARGEAARVVPLPSRLVRELLDGGNVEGTTSRARKGGERVFRVEPKDGLHEAANALEMQLYTQLFAETEGDFEAMARAILGRDDATSARRVRLRFNQLGLRVRPATPARKSANRR